MGLGNINVFKKVWVAIFFIIIWSVWKERNNRIFQQSVISTHHIKDLILLRLGWWIKGWDTHFPYSSEEVLRNPQCLRWRSTKAYHPKLTADPLAFQWEPPQSGHLKWNVDASLQPTLNKTSIGGVLRDSDGNFLCLFSSPILHMEINIAEIFAIHKALKITQGSNKFKNSRLIIESDSANAVKWCNEKNGGPWNIQFVLNFIRNISTSGIQVSIHHRGRESNGIADGLAKQGLIRRDDFIAWV